MPIVMKNVKPLTPLPVKTITFANPVNVEAMSDRVIRESHDAFFSYSSMRRLIHQQEKLLPKLDDEALQDDPAIHRASMVSIDLDRKMAMLLSVIASSETDANHAWVRLSPDQRTEAAHWWNVDPKQDHLIGQTFIAWPECEIAADFPAIHLPRILRNVGNWSTYDDWKAKGVYRP